MGSGGAMSGDNKNSINDMLLSAIYDGNATRVRSLLKKGADANTCVCDGVTALMCAVRGGCLPVVQELLKKDAEPMSGTVTA